MSYEPSLEPAPDFFRKLFSGAELKHLDEMVLSWRLGDHPISWESEAAFFHVRLESGPATLWRLLPPGQGNPACVEVDVPISILEGIPENLVCKLMAELAYIGKIAEEKTAPISVPLGIFSQGDRKVFLAYALTIARSLACSAEIKIELPADSDFSLN